MSHRIEYQWVAFKVNPNFYLTEPRYVVAIEGGDNNCYSSNGKRSRSWCVCMIGTLSQVLKQAVYYGGACEGGGLKPSGRDCKPEDYIRRIRRLVTAWAPPPDGAAWFPELKVNEGHPAIEYAKGLGVNCVEAVQYGQRIVKVDLHLSQSHLIFDFVDRFPDLSAWRLASVIGLRPS